jgi:hypothetical protein
MARSQTLTGLDVESVDQHGGPARPQVFGKAKRELGVSERIRLGP